MSHDEENLEQQQQQFESSHEDYYKVEKITVQDILDHITGPVISIIFHVVFLALIGTIVIFQPPEKRQEIVVEVKEVDVKELEKIPEPPQPPEEVEDNVVQIDRPTVSNEAVNVEVQNVAVESAATDVSVPDVLSIKPNNSALKLSGVFAMRSGSGRLSAIKKYGGSGKTETSVNKGLQWLASKQKEDGSWGEDASKGPALTAMAVLTFLAHGETPQSQEYGSTVLKGLKKLIEFADTIGPSNVIANGGNGYGHAMVAYAISEGYALTKIPMLEKSMNRMIKTVVDGQNRLGSYNYNFGNADMKPDPKTGKVDGVAGEPRCDLSVGGWNYQALKAGFAAGATVPGLETAMEKGIQGIEKIHGCKNGGFAYGRGGAGGGSFTMTGVGTLCLQLMGAGKSSAAKNGVKHLEEMPMVSGDAASQLSMDWKHIPSGWSLYGWYYMTQALFQGYSGSGSTWRKWNNEFTKVLMKEQEREGYWRCPYDKYPPKGSPGHAETCTPGVDANTKQPTKPLFTELDSQIWATTMCCLMLEVYYRYLPTFKVVGGHDAEGDAGGGAEKKKDDDLSL